MKNISVQSQNQFSARTLAEIRELVAADDPLLAARLLPVDPAGAQAHSASPSFADIFMAAFGADAPAAGFYRLGLEFIFEGYLLHWRRSRLIEPQDGEFALLAGDYMYARGLESICRLEDTACIAALAGLVGFCSRRHATEPDTLAVIDAWTATTIALARHARADGSGRDPLALLAGALDDIPAREGQGRRLIEQLLADAPEKGRDGLRGQIDEVYSGLETLWRSTT